MSQYSVVVAGGTRARFFTLEEADYPEMESGPNLIECCGLINPELAGHSSWQWSDLKSGRNRAPGGANHGYDDHREQHEEEYERRFARAVADEARRISHDRGAGQMLLVARQRMLGYLREAMEAQSRNGVRVLEVAKDLTKMSAQEVHEHLSRDRLLPRRRTPATV
jgi:protein required for attachment to host cells